MQDTIRLRLGTVNAYLIPLQDGYLLVDAGQPRIGWPLLRRALAARSIAPTQIQAVLVTHVHFDHVGGLRAVQQISGAAVLVHEAEADWLHSGRVVIPPGANTYGRIAHRVGELAARAGLLAFPAVHTLIHITDDGPVDNYASHTQSHAQLIHTPGHSPGSVTLLRENGDALVGDLAANHFPGGGPILPPFFGDRAQLMMSWRKVLDAGAQRILPGHGGPFPASRLAAMLDPLTDE